METPFVFGVAASGDNFTDRKEETKRLSANFRHNVNTILISPRRWGKTSLVNRVKDNVSSDKLIVVMMDVFSCRTEKDFYNVYSTAILKQTSGKLDEWVKNAKQFLSRIIPKISIGPDPLTDFSVSLEINPRNDDADYVLGLPERIAEKREVNIVICIDEFQQIAEFDKSIYFQRKLRSIWQHHKKVSYCLYGSRKHLMTSLFSSTRMPFYLFGDMIFLSKINTKDWVSYIISRFESSGKTISEELASEICLYVDNHSAYVQQLSWLLWIHTDKDATQENLNEAIEDMHNQNSSLFEEKISGLSAYQMNFMKALVDGVSDGFSNKETISKYDLGSSANVVVVKKALVKKELIDIEGKKVSIIDPILEKWFVRK